MTKLKLLFIASWLLIVVICFFSIRQCNINKSIAKEKEIILTAKETLYKNDSLQNASKVITWSLKFNELKKAHEKSEKIGAKNISEYEQKLAKAYEAIKLSESKERKVKEYYESLLSSRDTFYQPMPADCELKPIRAKFINIDFIYQDTMVGVSYDYHTGQNIVITMFPKLKENGRKHFPNWGFLPWVGWDNVSVWTVEDKKATITNQLSIKFKK